MIFSGMPDVSAYAAPDNVRTNKILFVTDTQGILELSAFNAVRPASIYVDYANYEAQDFDVEDIATYRAVAFPYCESLREEIRAAYSSGCTVYLYGELTIQDYKAATGLEAYALDINLYSEQGYNAEKISQSFDAAYEEGEIFQVISYSADALLCKIAGDTRDENSSLTACRYLLPIAKNFSQMMSGGTEEASTDNAFDIVTIWGVNGEFSASVDYRLYRNCDETDPVYNYFSIETSVQIGHASGRTESVWLRYELPYTSDNLMKTWPDFQNDYTVSRGEDYTKDSVAWEMTSQGFLPFSIDESPVTCGASWAAQESSETGIDLFYEGTVKIGPFAQYPSTAGCTEIPIRFWH